MLSYHGLWAYAMGTYCALGRNKESARPRELAFSMWLCLLVRVRIQSSCLFGRPLSANLHQGGHPPPPPRQHRSQCKSACTYTQRRYRGRLITPKVIPICYPRRRQRKLLGVVNCPLCMTSCVDRNHVSNRQGINCA